MNWEVVHALTMLPGFIVSPQSVAYKLFCGISCAYHFCKAFRKRKFKTIQFLQRADLISQLVACLANSKSIHQRTIILGMLVISSRLNIRKEKERRIHLGLNGASILLCNGFTAPSIYMWTMVFACCVLANTTHIQVFHSLMHLFGHAAFSLQT